MPKKHQDTAPEQDQVIEDQVEESAETEDQPTIEDLVAERDDLFDQLQRSRAEFINFRKRTEQERLKLGELIVGDTLKQFLPVIDDFDRAMAAVPAKEKDHGWVSGVTLIQKKFHDLLGRTGVKELDVLNKPFDPTNAEAVATDTENPGDDVVEVFQKGYIIGNTVLRPAMVKTGKAMTPQA